MSIRTRFLLLSDTHANLPKPSTDRSYAYRWPFPSADVAIHTGDLTITGTVSEHEKAVDLLKHLPAALKIVIPGNHDLTLDGEYYARRGELYGPRPKYNDDQLQHIRDLYTGPEAQAANIVYLEEGTRTFNLQNGARLAIYASAYTPEFCDWAFAYPHEQDRFNDSNASNQVQAYKTTTTADSDNHPNIDVMLTHGPPYSVLDQTRRGNLHVGCKHLLRAAARSKPLLHCFGHIHEGWGAELNTWKSEVNNEKPEELENVFACRTHLLDDVRTKLDAMVNHVDCTEITRGRETAFVNSSIMDVRYKPVQGPFVVDIMLDRATDAQESLPNAD